MNSRAAFQPESLAELVEKVRVENELSNARLRLRILEIEAKYQMMMESIEDDVLGSPVDGDPDAVLMLDEMSAPGVNDLPEPAVETEPSKVNDEATPRSTSSVVDGDDRPEVAMVAAVVQSEAPAKILEPDDVNSFNSPNEDTGSIAEQLPDSPEKLKPDFVTVADDDEEVWFDSPDRLEPTDDNMRCDSTKRMEPDDVVETLSVVEKPTLVASQMDSRLSNFDEPQESYRDNAEMTSDNVVPLNPANDEDERILPQSIEYDYKQYDPGGIVGRNVFDDMSTRTVKAMIVNEDPISLQNQAISQSLQMIDRSSETRVCKLTAVKSFKEHVGPPLILDETEVLEIDLLDVQTQVLKLSLDSLHLGSRKGTETPQSWVMKITGLEEGTDFTLHSQILELISAKTKMLRFLKFCGGIRYTEIGSLDMVFPGISDFVLSITFEAYDLDSLILTGAKEVFYGVIFAGDKLLEWNVAQNCRVLNSAAGQKLRVKFSGYLAKTFEERTTLNDDDPVLTPVLSKLIEYYYNGNKAPGSNACEKFQEIKIDQKICVARDLVGIGGDECGTRLKEFNAWKFLKILLAVTKNMVKSWVEVATGFKGGTNYILHSQNLVMLGTGINMLNLLNLSNGKENAGIVRARMNVDDAFHGQGDPVFTKCVGCYTNISGFTLPRLQVDHVQTTCSCLSHPRVNTGQPQDSRSKWCWIFGTSRTLIFKINKDLKEKHRLP